MSIHAGTWWWWSICPGLSFLEAETKMAVSVQGIYPASILEENLWGRKATEVHAVVLVSHWLRAICQWGQGAGATSQALLAKITPVAKGKSLENYTVMNN